MIYVLAFFLCLVVLCTVVVVVGLLTAPEGFEDETGFNYGVKVRK